MNRTGSAIHDFDHFMGFVAQIGISVAKAKIKGCHVKPQHVEQLTQLIVNFTGDAFALFLARLFALGG